MKSYSILLLFLFLFPFTDSRAQNGYTSAKASVNEMGNSTYEIPLILSPGTREMVPELSLNYNSQGGNNLLGIGWSLGGLSAITRIPATQAQDGLTDAVDFDASDRFALNGERLIAVNGPYGGHGTEYRTEQESFARVRSYGNGPNGPTWFRVWTRDDRIMDFGGTTSSRVFAQGKPNVLTWQLSRVRDRYGNYYSITYNKDLNNSVAYPLRIDYTGNDAHGLAPYASVRFEYENRPDQQLTYTGGSEFRMLLRLRKIRAYYGNTQVRSYHMTYASAGAAQFSRVTKIQECGSDGKCFKPITFNWGGQNESGNFNIRNPYFPPNNYGVGANDYNYIPGDFDGDGKEDLIHLVNNSSAHVWLSNGDGTYRGQISLPANFYGVGANDYSYLPGDFYGDGMTDLVHFVNNDYTHVWLSNGDCTFQIMPGFNIPGYNMNGNDYNYQTGDFNGDGRTDLIHLAGNRTAVVWLSNGNGTFTLGPGFPNTQYRVDANDYAFLPGENTGEGKTELVQLVNKEYLHVWASPDADTNVNLKAFDNNGYSLNDNNYNFRVGDYNGDGKADLLHLASNSRAYTWTSKGDGTFNIRPAIPQGSYGISANDYNYIQGDFNGDGLTDLAHLANRRFLHLWYATGNGTFNIASAFPNAGYRLDANSYAFLAGDHTGNGKTDLIHFVNNDYIHVWTSPDTYEQLKVNHIVNGNQNVEFDYFPLTNDIVYTKTNRYSFPKQNYMSTRCVVGDMRISDGLGGMNVHSYRYSGGKLDLQGRGFRGFDTHTHFDFTRNYRTTTVFERDFKCITARVKSQEVRLISNNKRINRIDNVIQIVPLFGGRVHFSYFKKATVKEFELNNQLIQRKEETSAYDQYGNMTLKETKYFNNANVLEQVETTETTFHNQINTWLLGRTRNQLITHTAVGQAPIVNQTVNHYAPNWIELTKQVFEPNTPSLRSELQNTFNAYGNIVRERIFANAGTGNQNRDNEYSYDANQRFIATQSNALNHVLRFTYEQLLGNIITETSPNNLVTTKTYDGFGREKTMKEPDRPIVNYVYSFANGSATFNMLKRTSGEGIPTMDVWTDIYEREVRMCTEDRKGRMSCESTDYLTIGMVGRKSEPYFLSQGPSDFTTTLYDARFRKIRETLPGPNRVRNYVNNRLTVTMTNELGQTTSTRITDNGNIMELTDANNQATRFLYNSRKNRIKTTMPGNKVVHWRYDALDRKIFEDDPNLGITTHRYNNFGERIETVNAKGQKITYTYDKLGRKTRQVQPAGTSTWVYDLGVQGLGKVSSTRSYNNYEVLHTYDGFGRMALKTYRDPSGVEYYMQYNYNSYGLLNELTYPTGFKVAHSYTTSGLLTMVKEAGGIDIYWRYEDENPRNQITRERCGLRMTNYTYDIPNGRILRVSTNNNTQDLRYHYDPLGNMLVRHDVVAGVAESMAYDNLNRVASTQITGGPVVIHNYDVLGNLTYRSDVGCYEYGSSRPHAVTRIKNAQGGTIRSMSYDAMGGMLRNGNVNLRYRASGKVWRIIQGNKRNDFFFDADEQRQFQRSFLNGAAQMSKRYVGSHFEQETNLVNNTQKNLHYIMVDGNPVAIKTTGSVNNTRYLHLDHLGSVQAITDENGIVVEKISHDVWGARRNPNTWNNSPPPATIFDRGFTFHEHLDLGEFIHMNARVYDPTIGRFNSADPFVQFMDNLQSYNRYSYTLNNPLLYTDPSGNFVSILAGVAAFVVDVAIEIVKDIAIETAIRLVFGDNPPAFLGYALQLANYDYENLSPYQLISETVSSQPLGILIASADPNAIPAEAYYDERNGAASRDPVGDFIIQSVLTFGLGGVAGGGKAAIGRIINGISGALKKKSIPILTGRAAGNAGTKLLPQFSKSSIEKSVQKVMADNNKLRHIFHPKHKLAPVVKKLGGRENTVREALNAANGRIPLQGSFDNLPIILGGKRAIIRGRVVDGIPRVGTIFIP